MMEKLYMKRLQHTIALTLSIAGGRYHMAWAAPAATELPTGEPYGMGGTCCDRVADGRAGYEECDGYT